MGISLHTKVVPVGGTLEAGVTPTVDNPSGPDKP